MKRRRAVRAAQARCVLDSGGLTGLIGRGQRARAWLRWVVESGGQVVVPTPILSECTTGDPARDAEVNRILGVLDRFGDAYRAPDEATARAAGTLRFSAGADDGVDAMVAAEAARTGTATVLLTSDVGDMMRLVASMPHVEIRRA